ncbi:hypothetical protein LTR64_008025 [Lithohypha guttulata]|uniref:uncharacterized protein n=1 Tax=Lithohypha guttulata TaxID=1690604 RepID=UPI00315D7D70
MQTQGDSGISVNNGGIARSEAKRVVVLKTAENLQREPSSFASSSKIWKPGWPIYGSGSTETISYSSPAVLEYDDWMHIVVQGTDSELYWATGTPSGFGVQTLAFPTSGASKPQGCAALAAVYQPGVRSSTGGVERWNLHMIYQGAQEFTIQDCTSATAGQVIGTQNQPSLISSGGKLFCAFLGWGSDDVYFCVWTPGTNASQLGSWSKPIPTGVKSSQGPALYMKTGQIHMVTMDPQTENNLTDVTLQYSSSAGTFSVANTSLLSLHANSCTALNNAGTIFLAFRNSQDNNVWFCELSEDAPITINYAMMVDTMSAVRPALVVDNGVLSCIYTSPTNAVTWSQATAYQTQTAGWMSLIHDSVYWTELSIPGTHDSGARFGPIVLADQWQAQDMDISQQLYAGIRYFDIRLANYGGILTVYHGDPAGIGYGQGPFTDAITAFNNFLALHPQEVVLCQIKQEDSTDYPTFLQLVQSVTRSQPNWVFNSQPQQMENLRGKVQVLYRGSTTVTSRLGIDLSAWPDNSQGDTWASNLPPFNIWLEDYYSVQGFSASTMFQNKWNSIQSMLDRARAMPTNPMDLNYILNQLTLFLAYTSFAGQPSIDPEDAALGIPLMPGQGIPLKGMNTRLKEYLTQQVPGSARLGVILMDFPDAGSTPDLIQTIIQKNNFSMTS